MLISIFKYIWLETSVATRLRFWSYCQIKEKVIPVEAQLVGDGVSDGLRIGGRARATAEDPLVDGREFIRHAVGDVSAAQITSAVC